MLADMAADEMMMTECCHAMLRATHAHVHVHPVVAASGRHGLTYEEALKLEVSDITPRTLSVQSPTVTRLMRNITHLD